MWCQHSSSLEQHESKNVMVELYFFGWNCDLNQYNTFPYDSLQPNYFTKTPAFIHFYKLYWFPLP